MSDELPVMTARQVARSKAMHEVLRNRWPGSSWHADLAAEPAAQADPDPTNPDPDPEGKTPDRPAQTADEIAAEIAGGLAINPPMTLGRIPEAYVPPRPPAPAVEPLQPEARPVWPELDPELKLTTKGRE